MLLPVISEHLAKALLLVFSTVKLFCNTSCRRRKQLCSCVDVDCQEAKVTSWLNVSFCVRLCDRPLQPQIWHWPLRAALIAFSGELHRSEELPMQIRLQEWDGDSPCCHYVILECWVSWTECIMLVDAFFRIQLTKLILLSIKVYRLHGDPAAC